MSAIDNNGGLEDYWRSHCYRWEARRNRRSFTEVIEPDLTRHREARFWMTCCCHILVALETSYPYKVQT